MTDSANKQWRETLKLFRQCFGKKRVAAEGIALKLRFIIKDPLQFEQFNHFCTFVGDMRNRLALNPKIDPAIDPLHYTIHLNHKEIKPGQIILPSDETEPYIVSIPYSGDPRHFATIARMFIAKSSEAGNRPNVSDNALFEDQQLLAKVTGLPWQRTKDSLYKIPVLEMKASPVNEAARRKQEFALGLLTLPDATAKSETSDWLEYQASQEAIAGSRAKTAVPTEWVSRTNIERANNALNPDLKRSIRVAFGRGA